MDRERREELRRWARSLADSSTHPDARAAARAVGLLLEEVDGLERELEELSSSAPSPAPEPAPRRKGRSPRLPRPGRGSAAAVLAVGAAAAAWGFGSRALAPELAAAGPSVGERIGAAAAARLAFSVTAERGASVRWRLDGADVTARAQAKGSRSTLDGAALADGRHTIEAFVPARFPLPDASYAWHVSIDRSPPRLAVDRATAKGARDTPLTLRGTVEDGAEVTADGRPAKVEDGDFAVSLPSPPSQPVRLVATDAHGNRTTLQEKIAVIPRRPRSPVRAVHVTFYAWADKTLRAGVMRLVDEGRVNAIELDLKDESGIVGFDADIPFARKIGSVEKIYDLRQAIALLHRKGIRVIGRIVAFRDPIHAQAAWKRGWKDQVIQSPAGGPYSGYGGFTNFADPVVRQYNIDVARRAAEAGIDEVLYDYVRRPDGPRSTMVFPGLAGTPEAAIASFLADAHRQLAPYGTFLGASVFGVAATRPKEVAQPIRAMARSVDYVAPMVYPSHWGPGEYDVANPNAQPYEIVFRSLADFQQQTRNTGARVVPWLQDFTLGVEYGPAEIQEQIRAAAARGIREWILWDPLVTYTADALQRHAPEGPIATKTFQPRAAPKAASAAEPAGAAAARRVHANELGVVPVLMYHQIRADGGGDYDLTPAQFRAELGRLYREGYVPIRAVDLATGTIDVPAGKAPVVMTFDDATKEQLAWDSRKRPKPNTAVAIMLDFARTHPGFLPAGTFYVNREPFAGVAEGPEMLRWLNDHGFEIGNHTYDHIPFNRLTAAQVRSELARGKKVITDAIPGVSVRTLALPLGVMPEPARLARRGSWGGVTYRHAGVLLVGAEPAPSPFSTAFHPGAIPRIRTTPPGASDPEFGSTFWLDELKAHPERRYVSDGDPATISFPRALAQQLASRFAGRADPY